MGEPVCEQGMMHQVAMTLRSHPGTRRLSFVVLAVAALYLVLVTVVPACLTWHGSSHSGPHDHAGWPLHSGLCIWMCQASSGEGLVACLPLLVEAAPFLVSLVWLCLLLKRAPRERPTRELLLDNSLQVELPLSSSSLSINRHKPGERASKLVLNASRSLGEGPGSPSGHDRLHAYALDAGLSHRCWRSCGYRGDEGRMIRTRCLPSPDRTRGEAFSAVLLTPAPYDCRKGGKKWSAFA